MKKIVCIESEAIHYLAKETLSERQGTLTHIRDKKSNEKLPCKTEYRRQI